VGTNTYDTAPIYIYPGSPQGGDAVPDEVWAANTVYFGMVHESEAGDQEQIVHVAVDSVTVTHTNNGFEAFAPYNLAAKTGNLTLDLTWAGAVDSEFSLLRSEGTDPDAGPYVEIANQTATAYTDVGLIDKRTYFYKVVSHYTNGVDSAESEILIVRALGTVILEELHWGTSTAIVTTDINFTRTPNATNGAVFFSEGNGEDGSLMHSNITVYNENVSLYGVLQITTNSSFSSSNVTGIDSFSSYDRIQVTKELNDSQPYAALIYMKPSAPLNLVAATYNMFGNAPITGTYMRFAIRNSGTWYISQNDFKTGGGFTLANLGAANWAEIKIADSSMTTLMAKPSDLTYAPVAGLDSVDAIGYYVYDTSQKTCVKELAVTTGTTLNDYEKWTDKVGLYNANTGRTLDPDDDGYNNAWEWGLGGDPLDPNDQGYTEDFTSVQSGLTNYFVYKHAMKKSPRPDYHLTETYNLQYVDFELLTNETVSTLGNWQGDTAFQTVTHKIPATDAVKFIKLNIE
jgi:hypothetical protein